MFLYTSGEGNSMIDDVQKFQFVHLGDTCLWLESLFPLERQGIDSSEAWVRLSKVYIKNGVSMLLIK